MAQKYLFAKLAIASLALLSLCSCIERWFPSKVSNGVARLTVNNLGKLVLAVTHKDFEQKLRPECRLKEMLPGAIIEASETSHGSATWNFEDCVYDFGQRTVLTFTDACGAKTITYSGRVIVSGRRTLNGILTGNEEYPVIPSQDGLFVSFSNLRFENFRVEADDQPAAMTMVSGNLSFDLKIAVGKMPGEMVCATPLPNPTFTRIQYKEGKTPNILRLPGLLFQFDAEVSDSDFGAQVGRSGNIENFLAGRLNLWGDERRVPSDGQELDPTYQASDYDKSLTCMTKTGEAISTTCEPEEVVANGISQLTAINLAAMLVKLENPETPKPGCDFKNFQGGIIKKTSDFSGTVTWPFENCVLDIKPQGEVVELAGGKYTGTIFGRVTFSGTRTVSGRLTGNATFPVVPETPEMRVAFTKAHFENFTIKIGDHPKLTLVDSILSFNVVIHLTKDEYGIFKVPLRNPTFEKIKYLQSSEVILSNPIGLKGDFKFTVNDSDLRAQFEQFGNDKNLFKGSINIFGKAIPVFSPALVPDYTPVISSTTIHDAPKDSFEKIEAALGDAVSRLSILNLSRMLQVIVLNNLASQDGRPECRLKTFELNESPRIERDAGKPSEGTVHWAFANCEYDLSKATQLPKDTEVVQGKVTLSGQRSIYGHLTDNKAQPVVPSKGEYHIDLTQIHFHDLKVVEKEKPFHLTMASGTANVSLTVPLKIDPKTKLYSEPADNDLILEHLRFDSNTQLIFTIGDVPPGSKKLPAGLGAEIKGDFTVPVSNSDINARIADNKIEGTIDVFNTRVIVPTDGLGLDMERHPLQSEAKIHQHDTMENFDALMVSRFLMLNLATIVQEASSEDLKSGNLSPNCGFSSKWVRYKGVAEGEVGQRGRMTFTIQDCAIIDQNSPASLPDPCAVNPPLIRGRVVASGTQSIVGLRNKIFGVINSIVPDYPHSVAFDFPKISVDNFETFMSLQSETISGGLRMRKGTFSAKVFPVLAEKKEAACDFGRTTPIAQFEVAISSDMEVELELFYRGQTFFHSKALTINSARLQAKNGFFDGSGNFLTGEIVINGGRFVFDHQIDVLDPFFTQEAFDKSYECRTQLEPNSEYFDTFAIREMLPPQGWTSTCPGAQASGYGPR